MGEMFISISERAEILNLYKKIATIAHPDRYVGDANKQEMAEQLFKEAQQHRTSLAELKRIFARAKDYLLEDSV